MRLQRALACLCLAGALSPGLAARESLRLPWVFSDEPDLCADFGFEPGSGGSTKVNLELGGRFAGFGLASGAGRAPKLSITAEFTAPSELARDVRSLSTVVDLREVLGEYGLSFARQHFKAGSKLVYKASLATELPAGDYNVRLKIEDKALAVESRRTLHLIVPELHADRWQLGDMRFITAVGKRLNKAGKEERVLDPNPWRQVGGGLGWDLQVAYSDLGPRPAGPLKRHVSIRRLRGDDAPIWMDDSPPPAKSAKQVWLLDLKEPQFLEWKAGVYRLDVALSAGGQTAKAGKTFEILP